MNYSKTIKIIRAARGLSQQDFATLTGIDPSLVSRIESGQRPLSVTNLKKISTKLSIPESLIKLLSSEETELKGLTKVEYQKMAESLLSLLIKKQNGGK
jgi:transcriptional regulator with XRE-family HTH domain